MYDVIHIVSSYFDNRVSGCPQGHPRLFHYKEKKNL